jgi:DNA-binding CsgD family transcriptional regulator
MLRDLIVSALVATSVWRGVPAPLRAAATAAWRESMMRDALLGSKGLALRLCRQAVPGIAVRAQVTLAVGPSTAVGAVRDLDTRVARSTENLENPTAMHARVQWVDRRRDLHQYALRADRGPVMVGRHPECGVCIADPTVSKHHALLSPLNDLWLVEDVGSKGGTAIVRGDHSETLRGRQTLRHGDRLAIGNTMLVYKDAKIVDRQDETTTSVDGGSEIVLTLSEQHVLGALCHPSATLTGSQASNAEIAERLVVSVETVRTHLKSIYMKLGVTEGTSGQRRSELVRRALREGRVTPDEFGSSGRARSVGQ